MDPLAWNDLPIELRSLLVACLSKFYISLKSFFFGRDCAGSASELLLRGTPSVFEKVQYKYPERMNEWIN